MLREFALSQVEYKSRTLVIHVFSFVLKTSGKAYKSPRYLNKRMKSLIVVSIFVLLSAVNAQRGSYAGSRPVINGNRGDFPTQPTGLSNRFGDDSANQLPVPIDALGDHILVNRLSQLPENKQPFWLLNYQIIEAHRNQPQAQFAGNALANRGSFQGR